jgi:hypothetical protein
MAEEHKHIWKRSKRRHKRAGRFFVQCECGITRQAVISYGHLHVFHTGASFGEKSRVVSYRLKPWQETILKGKGITFVEFVDQAFQNQG